VGSASEQGASPYLQRKGVAGHGVRYLVDGTLLVPMRDEAGQLQNLQRIAPAKPRPSRRPAACEKRFMAGGRKTGLWHLIGQVQTSAERRTALLLAEGYATRQPA
jgi:putative DNA primase/helicase